MRTAIAEDPPATLQNTGIIRPGYSQELDAVISTSQDVASLSSTALAEMERITILRVFEQANGDKALAGKMLGISRATLYRKLKRYNIAVKAAAGASGECVTVNL